MSENEHNDQGYNSQEDTVETGSSKAVLKQGRGQQKEAVSKDSKDAFQSKLDHPIKLDAFEGPLGLLLFLIRRSEIDIYDIPIESITRQYLDTLYAMETMNLDVAGDFFVMAATLMYIKSRILLPKQDQLTQDDEEEEGHDPRWELVQQLIEYKKFKEAASTLQSLIEGQQDFLPRNVKASIVKIQRPIKPVEKLDLWNAFNQVLRRLIEERTSGEIHDEHVTVAGCMEIVLEKIETTPKFRFSELVPMRSSFSFIISSFLAILELTRLKKLRLTQDEAFEDILCIKREDDGEISDILEEEEEAEEISEEIELKG